MPTRKAEAEWNGSVIEGAGKIKLGSGAFEGQYSFKTRMENGVGTNPEELIAGAHAACFSMALSAALGKAGFTPARIHTTGNVTFEKVGDNWTITKIVLDCEASIPGIDDAKFQEIAKGAKENCPVSKALAAVQNITLNAKLV
jgi:osmotically inducible protein OsmC